MGGLDANELKKKGMKLDAANSVPMEPKTAPARVVPVPAASRQWPELAPIEVKSLPPWPTSAQPPAMAAMVRAVSEATQTPEDSAGMLALATTATAVAKRARINLGPWSEPLNLFVAVAMDPGERKTAVFDYMVGPAKRYEASEAERNAERLADAQNARIIAERRLDKLRKQAAEEADEGKRRRALAEATELAKMLATSPKPVGLKLIADDSTPESLAKEMGEQGGRMAVLSDEGGVFSQMAGLYGQSSRGAGPKIELFLQAHAGQDYRSDRVSRGSLFISKAALTIGVAVQPDVIRSANQIPGARGRGLLGRFLYSMPKSWIGFRKLMPEVIPSPVAYEYETALQRLLDLKPADDHQGKPADHLLNLSPAAADAFLAFRSEIEVAMRPGERLAADRDWASKLPGAVGRIAGVLHLFSKAGQSKPWEAPVSVETMAGAIEIGRYLIPHALAAFDTMNLDPDLANARKIVEWLKRKRVAQFTRREALGYLKRHFPKSESMTKPLQILKGHGYIASARAKGEVYDVHPALLAGADGADGQPATADGASAGVTIGNKVVSGGSADAADVADAFVGSDHQPALPETTR